MNAAEQTESPTFEDVDENTSVGPANSPEETTEESVEETTEETTEPTTISSIGSNNSNGSKNNGSKNNGSNNNSSNNGSNNNSSNNSSNSNSSNSNSKPNTPAPVEANKKGMSVAAKTVLGDRMKTLAEMREAYAKAFGDDPKAPKAKSYEAFALTKIRKEQGEEAFKAKLQEYIERNQGIHAAKPAKGTRKKVSMATNAATNAGTINQGNSRQKLIQSVRTMADSAKDLIDNLVSATMSLAKSNTGDMTSIAARAVSAIDGTAKHRKTRSNKGKTHKMSAVRMNNSAM